MKFFHILVFPIFGRTPIPEKPVGWRYTGEAACGAVEIQVEQNVIYFVVIIYEVFTKQWF